MAKRYDRTKQELKFQKKVNQQDVYVDDAQNMNAWLQVRYGDTWQKKIREAAAANGQPAPNPTSAFLSEEEKQQRVLEAQQAALEATDPNAFGDVYEVVKGVSRAAFGLMQSGQQFTSNLVLDQGDAVRKALSGEGSVLDAVMPMVSPLDAAQSVEDAFHNTTWSVLSDKFAEEGFDESFGREGTGSGFFIQDQGSPVAEEKRKRSYEFMPLNNGEAATIGRYVADLVGFSKDSDPYNLTSGTIDFISALALDPTNVVGGGAASKGIKVAADGADLFDDAARAAGRIGEVAAADDGVKTSFKAASKMKSADDVRVVLEDKGLAERIDNVVDGVFKETFDDDVRKAAVDAKTTVDVSVGEKGKVAAKQAAADTADSVIDEAVEAEKNLADVEQQLDEVTASKPLSRDLPSQLARSAPRYGKARTKFDDGVTKALYIVAKDKPSKADEKFMSFLRTHFPELADSEIRNMGKSVRSSMKRLSVDENGVLNVPRFDDAAWRSARKTPQAADETTSVVDETVQAADETTVDPATDGMYSSPLLLQGEDAAQVTDETTQAADDVVEQFIDEADTIPVEDLEKDLRTRLVEAIDRLDAVTTKQAEALADFYMKDRELADIVKTKQAKYANDIKPGETTRLLEAYYGIADGGINVMKAVNTFSSTKFQPVLEMFADIDSFTHLYDLTGGKIGAETLQNLAMAKTVKDVEMVLLGGVFGRGDVKTRTISRLAYSIKNGKAGSQAASFLNRTSRWMKANTPSLQHAAFTDPDSVIKLSDDFMTEVFNDIWQKGSKVKVADKTGEVTFQELTDFRTDTLNRLAAEVGSPEGLKREFIRMQRKVLELSPGYRRVMATADESTKKALAARLNWSMSHAEDMAARTANIEANIKSGIPSELFGLIDDPATFDDALQGLITSTAELSNNMALIDVVEARRMFKVLDDNAEDLAKGGDKAKEIYNDINNVYDAYFRPMLLVRPAFGLLQLVDGAVRSMLTGSTNIMSSPYQTAYLAYVLTFSPESKGAKVLGKLFTGKGLPLSADGTPLFGSATQLVAENATKDLQATTTALHFLMGQFRDIYMPNIKGRSETIDIGVGLAAKGDEKYLNGWSWEAETYLVNDGDIDEMVYAVLQARGNGRTPRFVSEWANQFSDVRDMPLDEQIVEYFYSGPGRESFERIAKAQRVGDNQIPLFRQIVSDRNKLASFLFGDDEAASVVNRVKGLTNGFDSQMVDGLIQVKDAKRSLYAMVQRMTPSKRLKWDKGDGSYVKELPDPQIPGSKIEVDISDAKKVKAYIKETIEASLLRNGDEQAPNVVRFRNTVEMPKAKTGSIQPKQIIQDLYSTFFTFMGTLERRGVQAPFYRDEELYQSAKRLTMLSPEDAERVAETIGSQLPKFKLSPKQRQIRDMLKFGVANAKGKGGYTPEMLTVASRKAAHDAMADLMYGLKGRNAAAKRYSIFMPFVQAWGNAMRVYMKEMARSPHRPYNALRLLQFANSEDSGEVYDFLPFDNGGGDPSRPIIWVDNYGNQMVSVPYLGWVWDGFDSLLNTVTARRQNPAKSEALNLRISMWNPLNFGEPLPGAGLGATLPAQVYEAVVGDLPKPLHDFLLRYQPADVAADRNLVETLIESSPLGWLWASEGSRNQQHGGAMSALIAYDGEKYMDGEGGFISAESAAQLTRDSQELATSMALGNKRRAAMFRGGTSVPKGVETEQGIIPLDVIYAEWEQVSANAGTTSAGYAYILDKYGMNGFAYLVGTRTSEPGSSDEGYEFAKNNQDLFDATSSVLGYWYQSPDGRESARYNRLLSDIGKYKTKSAEEYAAWLNWTLYKARKYQLDFKLAEGKITQSQYDAESSVLTKDYQIIPQAAFNTAEMDKKMNQLRVAASDERLAQKPISKAVLAYLDSYEQVKAGADGESLDGESDSDLRALLTDIGNDLSVRVPEFKALWEEELKWEVEP